MNTESKEFILNDPGLGAINMLLRKNLATDKLSRPAKRGNSKESHVGI